MKPEQEKRDRFGRTYREQCEWERIKLGAPAMRHFRDREEHDDIDDRSDLQPFERTTTYPWGER